MKYPSLFFALLGCVTALLTGCSGGRGQLVVSQVPNYQPGSAQQLLFLNFKITEATPNEQTTLTNAVVGQGTMKNLYTPAHNPNYLRVLYHYDDTRAPREETYEHPLYRSVEVPSENGTLSRRELNSKEGTLNLRLPYDPHLVRLELFSHRPERSAQKLYTLRIKP